MVIRASHFIVTTALCSTVLALPYRPVRVLAAAEGVSTPSGVEELAIAVSPPT
jgi:hypothetical protein